MFRDNKRIIAKRSACTLIETGVVHPQLWSRMIYILAGCQKITFEHRIPTSWSAQTKSFLRFSKFQYRPMKYNFKLKSFLSALFCSLSVDRWKSNWNIWPSSLIKFHHEYSLVCSNQCWCTLSKWHLSPTRFSENEQHLNQFYTIEKTILPSLIYWSLNCNIYRSYSQVPVFKMSSVTILVSSE